jgi:hypothetical protein
VARTIAVVAWRDKILAGFRPRTTGDFRFRPRYPKPLHLRPQKRRVPSAPSSPQGVRARRLLRSAVPALARKSGARLRSEPVRRDDGPLDPRQTSASPMHLARTRRSLLRPFGPALPMCRTHKCRERRDALERRLPSALGSAEGAEKQRPTPHNSQPMSLHLAVHGSLSPSSPPC